MGTIQKIRIITKHIHNVTKLGSSIPGNCADSYRLSMGQALSLARCSLHIVFISSDMAVAHTMNLTEYLTRSATYTESLYTKAHRLKSCHQSVAILPSHSYNYRHICQVIVIVENNLSL
jgi:hypothetical protein